jgi:L-threonylcarbamoyladenylate synthase
MLRLLVNPDLPDQSSLDRAADVVRSGGVVAMPTDTLYGLAVDPFNVEAVHRLYALKGRDAEHAIPLVAADLAQVVEQLGALSPLASSLAERFWPGPLTLLMPAPSALVPEVSAGTGRVGVRVPAHVVTRALCRAFGGVLSATSANLTGKPASNDPEAVASVLASAVDVLLDAGLTAGGLPSTIVDASRSTPLLVREGAIPWEEVRAWLRSA